MLCGVIAWHKYQLTIALLLGSLIINTYVYAVYVVKTLPVFL